MSIWLFRAIFFFMTMFVWATFHIPHLGLGWGLGWSLLTAFVLVTPVWVVIHLLVKSKY